jgi:hypothetical protein
MSEYTAITKDAIVEGPKIEFDLYLRNWSGGNYGALYQVAKNLIVDHL